MAYPPPPQPGGFGPPGGMAPQKQRHGSALPALLLGIFSLVGFFVCTPAGIVCGIIAIIMGKKALSEIKAQPHLYEGEGMAKGGLIMGVIGLILCILGIILVILYYVLIIALFASA
jgi:hypothetical protein